MDASTTEASDKPSNTTKDTMAERLSTITLYRFFDESDRLLYVGISTTAINRWTQHRLGKNWWREVHHVTVQHFDYWSDAADAETLAIKTEAPRYNIQGALNDWQYALTLEPRLQEIVNRIDTDPRFNWRRELEPLIGFHRRDAGDGWLFTSDCYEVIHEVLDRFWHKTHAGVAV